ncbi:Helicase [Macrophomina phaseolina MS6]|uniref:ATP-dependent RNA helicase n=2 Tax=Macrophomina phaseolina TaxID=35725 RepID=K2SEY8_MACPH|nr:Helicase [Macrophomina phaseolina MS6]KAH7050068.1 ATP-dependent RNA helicase DBP7 [Macrophomina phaseolina]
MADDGMLLNFDLGDAPLVAKPSFKGGRWKDRLTAKKAALRREQRLAKPRTANLGDAPAENDSRPVKRQRVDDQFGQPRTNGAPSKNNQHSAKNAPPKQVVSSLFTYNPVSTTRSNPREAQNEDPIAPSNAPLSPELETFVKLGLSPNIAAHLLHKLSIKAPTAIQKSAIPQLVKDDSDAFIQAQTGSGKTLAYVLPIVQRLVNLGKDNVHRDSGLFAIILAPTRELSKQISVVLENVLRATNWIVSGTVIGGEKKKSEKARVRKGLNILVATPGRLVDHLEHTEALDIGNVRWLVLDEGDRLMELGFEHDIQRIVGALNLRMKANKNKIPGLPSKRMTILCSATMKMNVQRLGEISLKDAVHIQNESAEEEATESTFSAPAQLRQSYAVVPAKLRLVTLIAVLKRAFARKGSVMKVIVFISCADSVEFHFEVLARENEKEASENGSEGEQEEEGKKEQKKPTDRKWKKPENKIDPVTTNRVSAPSPTLSSEDNPVTVYKLHGSLAQSLRTSTIQSFAKSTAPAVLVCTDVASRGLDLPNVDFVIEYDPAFARDDHLHRIGRTARAGKDGRAMVFLQPGEEEGYVDILKRDRPSTDSGATGLVRHDANELLRKAFTPAGVITKSAWEDAATRWQLDAERWALSRPNRLELARRAYQSHVRAYATHVADERVYFNIKELHLGHLAKAFALRDRPGAIKVPGLRPDASKGKEEKGRKVRERAAGGKSSNALEDVQGMTNVDEAGKRMRTLARKMMGGASEFNLG